MSDGVDELVVAPALFHAGLHPFLVLASVFLEKLGCHGIGRRIRVRVAQQRLDGRQDGRHVVGRAPSAHKKGRRVTPRAWREKRHVEPLPTCIEGCPGRSRRPRRCWDGTFSRGISPRAACWGNPQ